jgi:hypothetical protein
VQHSSRAGLLLPLLLISACSSGDRPRLTATVVVTANPGTGGDIARLELEATLEAQRHTQTATAGGAVLALPLELTVPLRPARGRLEIAVRAFDALGMEVDRGSALVQLTSVESTARVDVILGRQTPARIAVAPSWRLAEPTVVGQTAPPLEVQISNLGGLATEPLVVTAAGDLADFTVDRSCDGQSLAPRTSCTLLVTFHPIVDGRRRLEGTAGGVGFVVEGDGLLRHPVSLAVIGNGRIVFNGGSCPGDCSREVSHGQLLALQAVSDPHAAFAGWSVPECPGLVPTCLLSVDRALTVTASFEAYEFLLTVDRTGAGFAMLDYSTGERHGCDQCSVIVPRGRSVRVIPTVSSANGFKQFGGDCQGEEPRGCTVVMDAPRTVRLEFSPLNVAFVTSEGVDGGIRSLAQADALCQRLGPSSNARTYRAWLSTSTVAAASRFSGARGWRTPSGRAGDTPASMLQGSLRRAFDVDGQNNAQDGVAIATGTLADGGLGANCDDWSSNDGDFTAGDSSLAATGFTEASLQSCSSEQRLLCLGIDFRSALTEYVGGQGYPRVFVSRGLFVPHDGPDAATALCQAEASMASLKGRFVAALGTSTKSLPLLVPPASLGVVRMDGELAWQGFNNFTPINLAADGSFIGLEPVWLGVAEAGFPGSTVDTCGDWAGGPTGRVALAPRQGFTYLDHTFLHPCASGAHVHCLEELP